MDRLEEMHNFANIKKTKQNHRDRLRTKNGVCHKIGAQICFC